MPRTALLCPFARLILNVGIFAPKDVLIDILYCGICHSDLHLVRNEWGRSNYPHGAGPRDRRQSDQDGQERKEV